MSPGNTHMFSYHIPDVSKTVNWIYDTDYFEKVESTAHDHRSITLRAKGTMEKRNTEIKVKADGVTKSVSMAIYPINLYISGSDRVFCRSQNTTSFTIKNIEYLFGSYSVSWGSTPTMTLVSGQGTATATYKPNISDGYGTVTATFNYNGKSYIWERKIFINKYNMFPSYAFIFTNTYGTGYWSSQTQGNSFGFREEDVDGHFDLGIFTHYELYVTDLKGREKFRRTRTFPGNPVPWLPEGWYICYVRGYTACGVTDWHEQEIEVVSGNGGGGELFPFSLKASSENAIASSPSPVSVKVYTFNTGTLVYSEKNVTGFNIQNTTLKDGIYIVVSTDQNGETKSEKVIKTKN